MEKKFFKKINFLVTKEMFDEIVLGADKKKESMANYMRSIISDYNDLKNYLQLEDSNKKNDRNLNNYLDLCESLLKEEAEKNIFLEKQLLISKIVAGCLLIGMVIMVLF